VKCCASQDMLIASLHPLLRWEPSNIVTFLHRWPFGMHMSPAVSIYHHIIIICCVVSLLLYYIACNGLYTANDCTIFIFLYITSPFYTAMNERDLRMGEWNNRRQWNMAVRRHRQTF
jgi:hypothetical protein